MKKRIPKIPVFSALLAVFVIAQLYNWVSNFSLLIRLGAVFSVFGELLNVVQIGLLGALAVMAVLLVEKPQLKKPAIYIAIAWGVWTAYDSVTGLLSSLRMGLEAMTLIGNLCTMIPTVITLVFWLKPAVNMVTGKPVQERKLSLFRDVMIALVFVLSYGIRGVLVGGGVNVIAVVAEGITKAIPLMAVYCASTMLDTAINAPQKAMVLTKDLVKSVIKYVITVALVLVLANVVNSCGSSGGQRGDGVNTCRNCGRETDLVAGFGYCGNCYEGFVDWQNRTWKD